MKKTADDFPVLYGPTTQGVPQSLQQMAQAYQQKYVDAANKVPLSLSLFGRGNEYQNALSAAWAKRLQGLVETQKGIDSITQPRNDAVLEQNRIDHAKTQGLIQQGAPDLYPRYLPGMDGTPAPTPEIPNYSPATLEANRKGMFAGSDINTMMDLQEYQTGRNYGLPNNKLAAPNTTGQLTGHVSEQAPGPVRPQLPFFLSDPQTIMQQVTSAGNNALTEGQKRYQFDQEVPKREADIKKTLQEVQKLIIEGKTEQARQKLLQAQTATEQNRPALIKAETKYKNEQYRGGPAPKSPNVIDLMTPEQQAEYAARTAAGENGPPALEDAYQQASLEEQANEKDWSGNPTARAKLAQHALRIANPGAARPAALPQGGGVPAMDPNRPGRTVVRGNHGNYSF